MKFLCGNCKAKYQIADEKVTGRTLRMKCRRCDHDILIDGHSMPPSSPSGSAPSAPRRRPASRWRVRDPGTRSWGFGRACACPAAARPRHPSARLRVRSRARSRPPRLSADFRRHVAAPPEVPQRICAVRPVARGHSGRARRVR